MTDRVLLEIVDESADAPAELPLTRARLLETAVVGGGALIAGGVLIGGLPSIAGSAASASQDVEILNFALLIEYLQASFYADALAKGSLRGERRQFARVVGSHEQAHLSFLKRTLGPKARQKPRFDFSDTTSDPAKFGQTAVVLEDDTVAQALRKFMATLELWKGRAAELLAELTSGWNGDIPEKWPKAGNKLSNRLRRVMPQLSAIGLQVTIGKTSDKSHHAVITVEKVGPSDDGGSRPEADQVAPPVSSEILLPSENPGNQGCSQVSRTAEVAGDLLPPEDGFDAQGVASGPSL